MAGTSRLADEMPGEDAAPVIAAEAVGLIYVSDAQPGIARLKQGDAVVYRAPNGRAIKDKTTLARIAGLVIPPAWEEVWICALPEGHLQATGRDARGRKQYRYHARWRATRDEAKYERLVPFAKALPVIRERVEKDLARPGLPRQKVVATVVTLLESTLIRVGNEEYARTNKSFGLTTMRDRHVEVDGSQVRFQFRGKSGQEHEIDLKDRRIAGIIRRCRDLPGQDLFQYLDDDGKRHTVGSGDINAYLQDVTGEPYTAKDFRTWAGTVLSAFELSASEAASSQTERNRQIAQAVDRVAKQLGNTRAVCRKCYIHPAVVDAYLDGSLPDRLRTRASKPGTEGARLSPEEAAVLSFLRQLATVADDAAA